MSGKGAIHDDKECDGECDNGDGSISECDCDDDCACQIFHADNLDTYIKNMEEEEEKYYKSLSKKKKKYTERYKHGGHGRGGKI